MYNIIICICIYLLHLHEIKCYIFQANTVVMLLCMHSSTLQEESTSFF